MVDIKKKVTLASKGEEAYVSVKQLMVSLQWSSDIDLDLMAFYRAKDGRTGGVFSNNYPGGNLGSLNSFPFIELSGDSLVGGEEIMRITKLDDLKELYIVTINYEDAANQRETSFSSYDGRVSVVNDRGDAVEVPLNSNKTGVVAIICKIDNSSPIGAKLINMNEIMSLADFVNTVPGANLIAE